MHPDKFGPYKKLLRQLVMDWYNHRVNEDRVDKGNKTFVQNHVPMEIHVINRHALKTNVTDWDICFMLAASHTLRREVNPHWWFVKSIH